MLRLNVLLAKKDYIYYFLEYFYSDIRYVNVGERADEFVSLANRLDFEVLAVGIFKPVSSSSKILSLNEFAEMFFELQRRGQVVDDEQEQLNEYCELLRDFINR